jgi:hypothetical protein
MASGTLKKDDTGWLTLNSTYNIKYRKFNGIVFVDASYESAMPDGNITLGTLPEEFRPSHTMAVSNYANSNNSGLFMRIFSNGTVQKSGSGGYFFIATLSYPV